MKFSLILLIIFSYARLLIVSMFIVYFFFFNDTATTEIYTFPYTTLFRSPRPHCLPRCLPTARSTCPCRKGRSGCSSEAMEVVAWGGPNRERGSLDGKVGMACRSRGAPVRVDSRPESEQVG